MAIPTNGQFMQQFYYTQPANTQDRSAWVPGSGVQTQGYGQATGYAPQQQQYAAYQQPQQYGGYGPPQQQYAAYQQPQQGWGQQAVAYQQYPQGPMGPMGDPRALAYGRPMGPMGYPGAQGPMGPMGPMGGPRPGSVPWMPARPTSTSPFGADPEGLLAILQQFGGLDDMEGLLPEDINPYVSARPDPQGRGVEMVVNRLAGLVGQITDVINQLGSVVQQLVNNQPVLAAAPAPKPAPAPAATPAPAAGPKDGSIEALLAALGFGGATPPAAPAEDLLSTNTDGNEDEIYRLLGELT